MTTGRRLFVCLAAWALMSATALADTPTVSNVVAKQRYPWNGLVDITCTVSGIDGSTDELKFAVAALEPESGSTNKLSHLWVMRDGTRATDLMVPTNGNYRLLWDAHADLGEVNCSNMVVRVTIVKGHGKVQLWEGGPYWAETNIGAEEPWEYGYYFWWGDTVGYQREGNAWVASDGSSQSFSFDSDNTPTYGKSPSTLQSEGWTTAEGVLAPEHDAAHVQWGGNWRMPTKDELSALNNNCDWTWTTQNGVNGYVVRGRGDYVSASIFLPAAGYGFGTSLDDASSYGFYWSSVPNSDSDRSWRLYSMSRYHYARYSDRYRGLSVRPVQGFSETPSVAAAFPLDTRTGVRPAREAEPLAYSTEWNDAGSVTITIDGTNVVSATAPAIGDYIWNTSVSSAGIHTLTFYDGVETLNAQFGINLSTVLFDANGGEGAMAPFYLYSGAEQTLPRCSFSSTNGFFLGWALSADGEATLLDGDSTADIAIEPGETITLYAVWHEGISDESLVAWYSFDGDATDSSGNENHGTVNGATLIADRNGNANSAYYFDGNDTIRVACSDSILSVTNAMTIATWIKYDRAYNTGEGWIPVICKGAGYRQFSLNIHTSGDGELGYEVGASFETLPQKSVWTHVAVTLDEKHVASAYVNGYPAGMRQNSQGLSIGYNENMVIGSDPVGQMEYLYGSLDDLGIWSRALSTGEIANLYACGKLTSVYAVRFDANGGEGAMPKKVFASGEDVTLPVATFTRDGYTFVGWATEPDGSIAYENGETVADGITAANGETITLYARWSPGTYAVHFNANGGTGALADQTLWLGIPEALNSNAFSRTGYTFGGWAESAAGEVLYTDNAPVTNLATAVGATVTLHAVWTPNGYTVRFHDGEYLQGLKASYYDIPSISDASWYSQVDTYVECIAYYDALTPTLVTNTINVGETLDFGMLSSCCFHGKYAARATENFVLKLEGLLSIDVEGTYSFRLRHDDGCVVYLDGVAIYSSSYKDQNTWYSFAANILEGVHELVIAFHEGEGGGQGLQFQMQGPSDTAMTGLPQSILSYGTPPVVQPFTFDAAQPLATNTFARTGYTLAGWATEKDGAVTYADSAEVLNLATNAGDVVHLHAVWATNTYTVCFDANGGMGTMANQSFVYDEAVALSTNVFTRANRFFAGWATEAGGAAVFADGEVVSNLTAAANGVVTLHAVWAEAIVTFDANGGEGAMDSLLLVRGIGQVLPPCSFSSTNGFFLGWALSADGEATLLDGDSTEDIAVERGETITLYAVWHEGIGGNYMVIDLSAGSTAESYPVSYLSAPPEGGFNTDEYKTTKLALRRIEPGTFMMSGSYETTLTTPYYIGVFEVTQKQWELVMGSNPSYFSGDTRPVERVSYNMVRGSNSGAQWPLSNAVDSDSYIAKLRSRTALEIDLPTEAQWEYACRAGAATAYYWGNSLDGAYCWYRSNSSSTHPVGEKTPNAWDLYDMHGNAWEWVLDWYGSLVSPQTDPVGAQSSTYRCVKGGSWCDGSSELSLETRLNTSSSHIGYNHGFRLAVPLTVLATYAIRFNANGGEGAIPKRVYASGEDVTLSAVALTRDGYTFVGWATEPDGPIAYQDGGTVAEGFEAANGETITLYACWSLGTYNVHFDADGGTGAMADQTLWLGIPEALNSNAFSRTGYTFGGWSASAEGEALYADKAIVTNVADSVGATASLHAVWVPNQYMVRYRNGTASVRQSFTYDVPQPLASNVFERLDYVIIGWATEEGGASAYAAGETVSNLTAAAEGEFMLYAVWKEWRRSTVGGRVSTDLGPVPGAAVQFYDASGTLRYTARTDENGAYAATGIFPASYTIKVKAPGPSTSGTTAWSPETAERRRHSSCLTMP